MSGPDPDPLKTLFLKVRAEAVKAPAEAITAGQTSPRFGIQRRGPRLAGEAIRGPRTGPRSQTQRRGRRLAAEAIRPGNSAGPERTPARRARLPTKAITRSGPPKGPETPRKTSIPGGLAREVSLGRARLGSETISPRGPAAVFRLRRSRPVSLADTIRGPRARGAEQTQAARANSPDEGIRGPGRRPRIDFSRSPLEFSPEAPRGLKR